LPTSSSDGLDGLLGRRLLFSYLAASAIVFVVAAIAVHFSFVAIINGQTAARLDDVARAGIRSVLFIGDDLAIDRREISNSDLLTREQGLQWFDRHGRLLGEEGLTPKAAGKAFDTVSLSIANPKTHVLVGTVAASESSAQRIANVRSLDIGLLAGAVLAALATAAGGLALARRAVQPVELSFQTLREFTDNASHELRGPLAAITTSADAALRDDRRDPAHDRRRFETIADGARQMSRLTSDLLLLAGAQRSLERELFVVDLAATLAQLEAHFAAAAASSQIALTVEGERAATVYGNPVQIERVLANLIENALRYTARGGRVAVELRRHGADINVVIRDNGAGIAPENLERVFERFWRADPVRPPAGSGLGLAIARSLARRHGGDVTVSSRLGFGSTFVATFPTRPRLRRA
jgi:OmpR-family two-component system manganese-sensing sensor histidine kinase